MTTDNHRALKIITNTIGDLRLDLSNYTILTEVGSSNFIYTPIIALLAGADKVFAWTKDSSYGKGEDIVKECLTIVRYLGLEKKLSFQLIFKMMITLRQQI